jgi:hypothetical protein
MIEPSLRAGLASTRTSSTHTRRTNTSRLHQLLLTVYRSDRLAVLDAIKDAKLKTLRIFISHTLQDNKDTGSVNMPDIEPQQVGTYDDTQLRAIDQLMVEAHDRGIKLVIAMHDRYQLGCWGNGMTSLRSNYIHQSP